MMKSNEIRVGNFILFSGVETKVIPQDFATQCRGINSSKMPNFEPIKLSKEWLIKFGFNYTTGFGESTYYKNGISIEVIGLSLQLPDYDIHIEYVHQLQNLYFALCGEELVFSTEP